MAAGNNVGLMKAKFSIRNVEANDYELCKKASSTRRASQAVPHPSTDRAFRRLTSEFGWDRVYSTQYGRWQQYFACGLSVGMLLAKHKCHLFKKKAIDSLGTHTRPEVSA